MILEKGAMQLYNKNIYRFYPLKTAISGIEVDNQFFERDVTLFACANYPRDLQIQGTNLN